MKKALKIIIPVVFAVLILAAAAWYLLIYRPSLTADYYILQAEKAKADGRYSRAVDLYANAETLDPENPDILLALEETYRQSGNYTKAEYTLVRAITLFPDNIDFYIALSRVYVEQDKLLDAEKMLSRIANDSIREQLAALRPEAPVLTPESGYYNDYIEVAATCGDNASVYLSTGSDFPTLSEPYSAPVILEKGENTVTAIAVSADGLVSTYVTAGYTIGMVDEEITFVDAALESQVRALLGKETDAAIMTSELWTITELTVDSAVTCLDDLSAFEKLESLTLCDFHGVDFTPISLVPSLRSLDLSGSGVSAAELEAVGTLSNLTVLRLSSCGLSTVANLSGLTGLQELYLDDNSIGDLLPLENMKNLAILDLSNNAVVSLTALKDCTALTWLSLENNPVTVITPLAACKALTYLNIDGCSAENITSLSGLTALTEFHASGNGIADISALSKCTALSVLDLSDNAITDITALGDIASLTEVQLDYNNISELPAFVEDCAIFDLSISHNLLKDISACAGLKNLNFLNVDYNEISDINILQDNLYLIQIDAFANPIADIQPLLDRSIIVNYDPTYIDTYVPSDAESDEGSEDGDAEA